MTSSRKVSRRNHVVLVKTLEAGDLLYLLSVGVEAMTTIQLHQALRKRELLELSQDQIGKIELQLRKAYIKAEFDKIFWLPWDELKLEMIQMLEQALALGADPNTASLQYRIASIKQQFELDLSGEHPLPRTWQELKYILMHLLDQDHELCTLAEFAITA